MDTQAPSTTVSMLPWVESWEDKRRLLLSISASLILFASLFLSLNFLVDYPEVQREQLEKIPTRVAKMILEKKKHPSPPPTVPAKKPEPEPEKPKAEEKKPVPKPKPEPKKVEPPKPKPVSKVAPPPKPKKPTPSDEQIKKAREAAANTGVLAMADQLAALRNMPSISNLANKKLQQAAPGSSQRNDRDLITRKALSGSGGIQTSRVSKPERQQLAQRKTTTVTGPAELAQLTPQEIKELARMRTSEEINLGFDKHKSAFYALYKRALRKNLGLQGRIVFNLRIAPNGKVTRCNIDTSELKNSPLERKLVARILLIDFGAKDVEAWEGQYHFDFAPAG